MALSGITLSRFRNHAETALRDPAHVNLLIGANGAGKTNVLEALSLLAPGRGLRRSAPPVMAKLGEPGGFAVGASLAVAGEVRVGTFTRPDAPGRRLLSVNGAAATGSQVAEWLSVGWLTPAMDQLFTAAAGERRRYIDRLALAIDPQHAAHALRYERALRERNRLLAGERAPDATWLSAVEAQMAENGARLAEGRAMLIDALMGEVVRHGENPFPRPALTYAPGGPVGEDRLSQALHDGRARDRAAGRTLAGPHRDDLEVYYAAKRMPAAASSTGEQKALLLAITLAHATLAAKGRPALLLLDEVAAHLDPARREALYARLVDSGTQVWITGTELAPFRAIADRAAIWHISDGTARRA